MNCSWGVAPTGTIWDSASREIAIRKLLIAEIAEKGLNHRGHRGTQEKPGYRFALSKLRSVRRGGGATVRNLGV